MTDEEQLAEDVAQRLQGLKKFTLHSRETVYYSRTLWAKDEDDALDIMDVEGDWGDAVNYADFETYDIEEETNG